MIKVDMEALNSWHKNFHFAKSYLLKYANWFASQLRKIKQSVSVETIIGQLIFHNCAQSQDCRQTKTMLASIYVITKKHWHKIQR